MERGVVFRAILLLHLLHGFGAFFNDVSLDLVQTVEVLVSTLLIVESIELIVRQTNLEGSRLLKGGHSQLIEDWIAEKLLRSAPEIRVELKDSADQLLQLRTALGKLLRDAAILACRGDTVEVVLGHLVCDETSGRIILLAKDLQNLDQLISLTDNVDLAFTGLSLHLLTRRQREAGGAVEEVSGVGRHLVVLLVSVSGVDHLSEAAAQ